jgi:hypothetical protein
MLPFPAFFMPNATETGVNCRNFGVELGDFALAGVAMGRQIFPGSFNKQSSASSTWWRRRQRNLLG